jgi:hypothetical protein
VRRMVRECSTTGADLEEQIQRWDKSFDTKGNNQPTPAPPLPTARPGSGDHGTREKSRSLAVTPRLPDLRTPDQRRRDAARAQARNTTRHTGVAVCYKCARAAARERDAAPGPAPRLAGATQSECDAFLELARMAQGVATPSSYKKFKGQGAPDIFNRTLAERGLCEQRILIMGPVRAGEMSGAPIRDDDKGKIVTVAPDADGQLKAYVCMEGEEQRGDLSNCRIMSVAHATYSMARWKLWKLHGGGGSPHQLLAPRRAPKATAANHLRPLSHQRLPPPPPHPAPPVYHPENSKLR